MKSKYWYGLGLIMATFTISGCANLNTLLSTEQRPGEISFDKYGFEKYLTEQEHSEWQQMLIPAIKADCQPPYGTLASEAGWPTNRIRISAWSHFNLTEEERAKVIGIVSFKPSYSYSYDTSSYTPAYSEMTYIFLPGYMYACWYPGYPNENTVQPIPYSALLKESTRLVWGSPGDADDKFIRAFSLSEEEEVRGYGSDRTLRNLENIYRVNQEIVSKKNAQAKDSEKQAVRSAEQSVVKKLEELGEKANAILEKNKPANQENISFKGIYIGMPINEAETLLCFYFSYGGVGTIRALSGDKTARLITEDLLGNWVYIDQDDGCLSVFEADEPMVVQSLTGGRISGEELARQIAEKYGITLEVDAYGEAWQYRDANKGVKIRIGGDGSIRMEKVKALIE